MLVEWVPGLAALTPELIWGVFTRSIGLVFIISFLSLAPQVLRSAGSRGAIPVRQRLRKIREDFDAPGRFFYFPTLLWANHGDLFLRILPLIGLCAASVVVYGGPLSPYAILACYIVYLTLDMPMGLIFPWDCMLFEIVLLGCFLPATLPLPELASVAAPAPALCWAYRLLVFRVMLGFGKNKFVGATSDDKGYLKGFLTAQPLPNIVGWYAQKLPMWVMHLLLIFMFVVEIPVPFFMLIPGDLSVIAAVLTAFLMIGIISFGSFGYFSLATIAGCIPLLDNVTPTQLSLSSLFGPGAPNLTNAYVLLHTFGSLFVFPFNSWVGQSWSLWTFFLRLPPYLSWPFALLRALHPFRWLHPYGVFPPKTFPAAKGAVMIEVTWDNEHWHECHFNFFASDERSRPRFVAPHHPRGDQAVIYETFGLNPTTMISSLAGPWDPYAYSTQPAAGVLCQQVLEGHGLRFLRSKELESHSEPPIAARVRTVLLEPASLDALKREGKYWQRSYLGPHTPPRTLDPQFWDYLQPEPEMWHPESIIWRMRSRLGKLMRRSRAGENVHRLVLEQPKGLTDADAARFWNEFIPALTPEERADWNTLKDTVPRLRAQFDRGTLRKMERLMGRYSALLEARLTPLYLHKGLIVDALPAKTYLHLWMLIQHIITQGRDTYDAVCADPPSAARHLDTLTVEGGMYMLCVFRYETMIFDAQKLRLVRAVMGPYGEHAQQQAKNREHMTPFQQRMLDRMERLFGYFDVAELLLTHFQGPEYDSGYPERYPTFHLTETGEVAVKHWPAMPDIPGESVPSDSTSAGA